MDTSGVLSPRLGPENGWLWHEMGYDGLNDKYLEGALHHAMVGKVTSFVNG